ncbi:DUF2274 domain-containing protein [Bradyrhizobium sp. RDI18]|uniref:DUF2274 domain-containing protein n=1 Tax=Bradyrhizobium sp. RDI18 TaxID=3367400 RepID=UPI003712D03C
MPKLKLGAIENDKPVKVTMNCQQVFTVISLAMLISWRPRGLSIGGPTLLRGFVIAAFMPLGASQLDQYLTHGRYADAAMPMLR